MITNWIVMLNYNTGDLCLANVKQFSAMSDVGVFVVDNASEAPDLDKLTALCSETGGLDLPAPFTEEAEAQLRNAIADDKNFVLARNSANSGFGAGNNVALRVLSAVCGSKLQVLVINPDVSIAEDALRSLLGDSAEICGPAVREGYLGAIRAHEPALDFSTGFPDSPNWRRNDTTAAWLSGCCLKFSGSALSAYGYFPEELFLYDEETFFFERVHRLGGKPAYRPTVVVDHKGSVTLGKRSFHYYYYIFRNRLLFFRNVARPRYGRLWRFTWLYGRWVLGAVEVNLKRKNWKGIRGVVLGVLDGLRGIDGRSGRA